MLIQALKQYYDILEDSGNTIPDGFSSVDITHMIYLNLDGEVTSITDIRNVQKIEISKDKKGNPKYKDVLTPKKYNLPKRTEKPGIDLNIIEHRPLYIFGLNLDKGTFTPDDKTDKAKKSHKCFVDGNLSFIDGLNSDIIVAYRNFLEKWQPQNEVENPYLLALGKDYDKFKYCFALDGRPDILLHKDTQILDKIKSKLEGQKVPLDTSADDVAICSITGEVSKIARIHDKLKGIKGGSAMGSVFIGTNSTAEESYGKSQAFNNSISETAMQKYVYSLNYLISNKKHRNFLDDITFVFWAMSPNDDFETTAFNNAFFYVPKDTLNATETDDALTVMIKNFKEGSIADYSALDKVDKDVIFYVVGLTPNVSRVSQKFIYRDKFGNILKNALQHKLDMQLENNTKDIPLWKITKELVSPKSTKDTVPTPLITSIFYSILNGTQYPSALLETTIRRIKLDSDTDKNSFIKINSTRVGIIKAYLNRKSRIQNKEEEITLSLNKTNDNPAYLCGRIFAMLEKIQKDALGNLNKTIKDSFFASACAKPSTVFPRLLMLSQNHLAKLDNRNHWNKQLGEVISMLGEEFPSTLSLDEQGKFIIGYYQQNQELYKPNPNKPKEETSQPTENTQE